MPEAAVATPSSSGKAQTAKRQTARPTLRDLRREEILDTAGELVASGGLGALTISALEKRLSFSRGVITYHFKNKEEIVRTLFKNAIQTIDAHALGEVESAPDLEQRIRRASRAIVHGFVDNPVAANILMSFWGSLNADAETAQLNADLYRKYRASARHIAASEEVPTGIDLDAFAAVFVGVVIGIACQALFDANAIDVDAATDHAARALTALLRPSPAHT